MVPDHLSDRPYVLRRQRVLVHERVHRRVNIRRRRRRQCAQQRCLFFLFISFFFSDIREMFGWGRGWMDGCMLGGSGNWEWRGGDLLLGCRICL